MGSQVVSAGLHGNVTQSGLQRSDMRRFVLPDLFEARPNPRRVAGASKGIFAELLKAFSVEGVLKVLEGQGEVEHIDV